MIKPVFVCLLRKPRPASSIKSTAASEVVSDLVNSTLVLEVSTSLLVNSAPVFDGSFSSLARLSTLGAIKVLLDKVGAEQGRAGISKLGRTSRRWYECMIVGKILGGGGGGSLQPGDSH